MSSPVEILDGKSLDIRDAHSERFQRGLAPYPLSLHALHDYEEVVARGTRFITELTAELQAVGIDPEVAKSNTVLHLTNLLVRRFPTDGGRAAIKSVLVHAQVLREERERASGSEEELENSPMRIPDATLRVLESAGDELKNRFGLYGRLRDARTDAHVIEICAATINEMMTTLVEQGFSHDDAFSETGSRVCGLLAAQSAFKDDFLELWMGACARYHENQSASREHERAARFSRNANASPLSSSPNEVRGELRAGGRESGPPLEDKQSVPQGRKRGRPVEIPDERKAKALAEKNAGGSNKDAAKILYGTRYPTEQQVKNVPAILKHYGKKLGTKLPGRGVE